MVIILQQTSDNGCRFISTVVEEEFGQVASGISGIGSCNSNTSRSNCSSSFSLTSQHSISEQSAIYKQRIDSLFGRQTKLNTFKPHLLEPFCIKIQDQQNSDGGTLGEIENYFTDESSSHEKGIGIRRKHLRSASSSSSSSSSSSDNDNDYQTILDNNKNFSSIVTDSLNNFSRAVDANVKRNGRNNNNVTSVQITTCDDEADDDDEISEFHERRQKTLMTVCSMGENTATENNTGHANGFGSNDLVANTEDSPNILWRNVAQLPSGSSHVIDKDRFSHHHSDQTSSSTFHGCDLRFSVEYLGCTPVEGNTTALEDLQGPLCSLYANFLSGKNILSGQLAITKDGLRFESPKLRLYNNFTTIAVWAAIKFVARGDLSLECAFMPLISDPEGQDKGRLFGKMSDELSLIYKSRCLQSSAGVSKPFRNPPIFACVMREGSFTLDCHAFVCRCAEDAIVVAANLYQSLVDKMRSGCLSRGNKEGESGYGTLTRNSPAQNSNTNQSPSSSCTPPLSSANHSHDMSPTTTTTEGRCSTRSTCLVGNDGSNHNKNHKPHRVVFSDSESLLIPIRPPRRNNKKKHSTEHNCKNLKQYNSDDSVFLKMPQRRISINKGNNKHANYRPQYIKNVKRVKISTPEEELSSSSSEFVLSESIDQVLDRIINPGGMSFNDLKPSYQQLLLKIALTLTQDQLYQKSKEAMKKYQLPTRGGNGKHPGRKKLGSSKLSARTGGIGSEEHSQFLGAFLKSFSKITSGKMMSAASTSSAMTSPSCSASSIVVGKRPSENHNDRKGNGSKPMQPSKLPRKVILKKSSPAIGGSCCVQKTMAGSSNCKKDEEPFMSMCSGCACDKCSDKCYCSLPSKSNVKVIGFPPVILQSKSGSVPTEPKLNHCSVIEKGSPNAAVASTSTSATATAITTKVCGYDTDSCAGSEKCYCSLQRVKSNGLKIYNINLDTETSDTDTNSYDLEPFNPMEPTTTTSSSSNLKTVSTKSVEILSYHPARRLSYCSSNGGPSPTASVSPVNSHHGHIGGNGRYQGTPFQTTNATVHHHVDTSNNGGSSGNGSPKGTKTNVNGFPHSCNNNFSSKNQHDESSNSSPSTSSAAYFRSTSTPKGILCNSNDSTKQNKPHCSKVLLMTGVNSSPQVMYKEQTSKYSNRLNDYNPALNLNRNKVRIDSPKNLVDINEDDYDDNHDRMNKETSTPPNPDSDDNGLEADKVLSMKKTAEIAAMFKDLHLNQTQISYSKNGGSSSQFNNPVINYDSNNENLTQDSSDSIDFEASLGYLP